MHEKKTGSIIVKGCLVGISVLFLFVVLLLPLFVVITEALRSGWNTYVTAITDKYTISALTLTLKATLVAVLLNTRFGIFAAWTITKFHFKGK